MTKTERVPGHKLAKVLYAVKIRCECGWETGHWYGNGAAKQANGEWRWHLDECRTQLPAAQGENR